MPAGKLEVLLGGVFHPGEFANPKKALKRKAKSCIAVGLQKVSAPVGQALQDLEKNILGDWEALPSPCFIMKASSTVDDPLVRWKRGWSKVTSVGRPTSSISTCKLRSPGIYLIMVAGLTLPPREATQLGMSGTVTGKAGIRGSFRAQ
jgi:hypothetical protein